MSHTPPPDHPAPPALAGRTIQPRFGQIEQSCRQLLLNHLDQHLGCTFEQADDALFAQANKATNNREQALFFDSMREVRTQRAHIIRHFHQRLAGEFAAYFEGRPLHGKAPTPTARNPLSLIAHDEHEESLLLGNMVKRCQSHCATQLDALTQRLAQLCRDPATALKQDAPCTPEAIATAFRLALPDEALPLRIRRVLYDLFEQQVMSSLAPLYSALNKLLIEANVLPQLSDKLSRPRTPARPSANPPPPEGQGRRSHGDSWPSEPRSEAEQLFQGVTRLLSRRHGNGNGNGNDAHPGASPSQSASAPPSAPAGTYSETELMAALTRLQQVSAREIVGKLYQPQDAKQLKARLHAELEAACTLPDQQMLTDDDADIIDLVGMLFAFILDDPALPDRCKTVLSHLHTPYLKLALRDRRLFTHGDHPARQLLDCMAKAGARFAEDSDTSGLQTKMQLIVERIIQDFSGDATLFPSLLQEFEEYLRRLQQRVELRERRTLDAARGNDRMQAARQQAGEQIRRVLIGRTLPRLIQELLESGWRDVLALTHLRQGEQSDEWRRACLAAEQLAWSCTPLDHSGRERLQRERLELLEQLRMGLQRLGSLPEDRIRRLLQDVVTCQHAVQAQQPELAARLSAQLPDNPLGAMLQGQPEAEQPAHPASSADVPEELEARLQQLQSLPFGTLFGFQEDGQQRRLRLSWFSPATRHYLFIDPSGEHSRSWPAAHLAQALLDGNVRLLGEPTDTPLMERALQAIYRVLQRMEDGKPLPADS
ncbi:DUF1631 domain-containing protein [Pseudomonas sp. MAP12]|uniref:DUF1631 domain-containing protein n=1 Tax=Geopseudomonas aromaticivorans TaxID=2849492 RepID=A0ABS6N0B9_9GAMM|nr:DUF1631 domain-containing protein [Pseudomonas aromaticivorans]MBV2134498.1 DUF1631 domain-containing protein [Pseudomonas aromaticivorans]